jgi:hypothetical protein
MSDYPEEGSFQAWCESPMREKWRGNLTDEELATITDSLRYATSRSEIDRRNLLLSDTVIAKLSKLLDTLSRLCERIEEQRMELIMPKEQAHE